MREGQQLLEEQYEQIDRIWRELNANIAEMGSLARTGRHLVRRVRRDRDGR